eukprot:8164883-Prorocentrum_lima.AAC.1
MCSGPSHVEGQQDLGLPSCAISTKLLPHGFPVQHLSQLACCECAPTSHSYYAEHTVGELRN